MSTLIVTDRPGFGRLTPVRGWHAKVGGKTKERIKLARGMLGDLRPTGRHRLCSRSVLLKKPHENRPSGWPVAALNLGSEGATMLAVWGASQKAFQKLRPCKR